MSVYVNTEVAEDSLLSELMQCFLKTDFEDDKIFKYIKKNERIKTW